MNQTTSVFRIYLSDIRFWILVFFLLRIYGITDAPLETGHNWRQSLTNMIARNFLQSEPNIFFPRIDMAGSKTGIIGSEFPFFNYLIYLLAEVFGYAHWYGRLINLIVSSLGVLFFHKLISLLFNQKVAFHGAIVLLTSIWFGFSRKIMPDTFSVSLMLIGFYYGYIYLKQGKWINLLLYFVLVTLGVLCKIPALSLMGVLGLLLISRELPRRRVILTLFVSIISFGVVSAWYFHWVPYLLETYGFQLYFPKGLGEGIQEIRPLLPDYLKKFYFSALYSYVALTMLIVGIVGLVRKGHLYAKLGLLAVAVIFVLFTFKTGAVFPTHNYYIIPFVPVMALVAGYGLAMLPRKTGYVLTGLIALEGLINQVHDFKIKDAHKLQLEGILDPIIPEEALIVINGGPSPQSIYFANRKGWTIENSMLQQSKLDSLHQLGASYLVLDKELFPQEIEYYQPVYEGSNYIIYSLDHP